MPIHEYDCPCCGRFDALQNPSAERGCVRGAGGCPAASA
jgi:hypothetical protein